MRLHLQELSTLLHLSLLLLRQSANSIFLETEIVPRHRKNAGRMSTVEGGAEWRPCTNPSLGRRLHTAASVKKHLVANINHLKFP